MPTEKKRTRYGINEKGNKAVTTRAERLNSERGEKAKPFSDTFEASSKEDEKKTEDKLKESERLRNKYPNL
jgi:hypothetical protein